MIKSRSRSYIRSREGYISLSSERASHHGRKASTESEKENCWELELCSAEMCTAPAPWPVQSISLCASIHPKKKVLFEPSELETFGIRAFS